MPQGVKLTRTKKIPTMLLITTVTLLYSTCLARASATTNTPPQRRLTRSQHLLNTFQNRLTPNPRRTRNQRRGLRTQKNVRQYIIYEAKLIHHMMFSMAEMYPDFTTLTSAQELYGLPAAGEEDDCPFDHVDNDNNRRRLEKLHDLYTARGERGFPRTLQTEEGEDVTEAPTEAEAPIETEAPTETETETQTETETETQTETETETQTETEAPVATEAPPETGTETQTETEAPIETEAPTGTEAPSGTEASIENDDNDSTSSRSPKGCYNYILTIEDKLANPPPTKSKQLPEIFLSGTVHGNERVGPTAVIETALLLLSAAHCESLPHGVPPLPTDPEEMQEDWRLQVDEAEDCRAELRDRGVNDGMRQWLARLVSTRRIVVLPTANALGYYRNEREEAGVDPNRDFPYDLKDGDDCMETIAARTINEIFRDHMFQLAITFHSGSSSVTYEWGAPTYEGELSPDDEALKQLVAGYVRYGGAFPKLGIEEYDWGTMNDVVYSVRGGMEDWAYAGSWDHDRVRPCHPNTYGGYDETKTIYDGSSLRVFNTLVETSDDKTPPTNQLGTDEDVFSPRSGGTGHIPRNIRLSLLMADVVQPYLAVRHVNDLPIEDDIVPLRENRARLCRQTRVVSVPKDLANAKIEWSVGGGFNVDASGILLAKWGDLPAYFNGVAPPTPKAYKHLAAAINGSDGEEYNVEFFAPPPFKEGRTRWHESGSYPASDNKDPYGGPIFTEAVPLELYDVGDEIAVYAWAQLDSYWATQPDSKSPDVPPQSHFVNARTNEEWRYSRGNQTVIGQIYYFSVPITIVVGEEGSELEELSERLPVAQSFEEEIIEEVEEVAEEVEDHMKMIISMGVAAGLVVLIAMYGIGRRVMYGRVQVESGIEIGDAVVPTHTID